MSDEMDPEVLADLRLRESSEHDKSRTRGEGVYDWKSERVIGMWRCRNSKCAMHVPVTQDAYDHLEVFNRELAKKGEKPISTGEVMYCERCETEHKRTASIRRRNAVERMASVIRQLKAGEKRITIYTRETLEGPWVPDRTVDEREAFEQLEQWGHPDVEGFRQALTARLKKQRGNGGKL